MEDAAWEGARSAACLFRLILWSILVHTVLATTQFKSLKKESCFAVEDKSQFQWMHGNHKGTHRHITDIKQVAPMTGLGNWAPKYESCLLDCFTLTTRGNIYIDHFCAPSVHRWSAPGSINVNAAGFQVLQACLHMGQISRGLLWNLCSFREHVHIVFTFLY